MDNMLRLTATAVGAILIAFGLTNGTARAAGIETCTEADLATQLNARARVAKATTSSDLEKARAYIQIAYIYGRYNQYKARMNEALHDGIARFTRDCAAIWPGRNLDSDEKALVRDTLGVLDWFVLENGDVPDCNYEIGRYEYDAEDYEHAKAAFTRELAHSGTNSYAYLHRGRARYRLDDVKGAYADVDKYIDAKPGVSTGYHNRGFYASKLGWIDRARKDYAKALELDPDNGSARANLAALPPLLKPAPTGGNKGTSTATTASSSAAIGPETIDTT